MTVQSILRPDDRPGMGDPGKIRVVLYRQSQPGTDTCPLKPDTFRRQLHLLESWGYTLISFDDYRLFQSGKIDLPRRPLILTFDRAESDVYDVAFPILSDYGAKAVIFVASRRTSARTDGLRPLTDQQIVEMHTAGCEIGSCGVTGNEDALRSSDTTWNEISQSRMDLEIVVSGSVRSFAYPSGTVSDEFRRMVKDAGYTIGCTAAGGPRKFDSDLLSVRRTVLCERMMIPHMAAKFWIPSLFD